MNPAWYLGFGWTAIVFSLLFGIASYYYSTGWVHWVLYVLFVVVVAYMVTKLRLYVREPWRRIHHRGMDIFRKITDDNSDNLYTQLAKSLLGVEESEKWLSSEILTDDGRKRYYKELVEAHPAMFTHHVRPELHAEALACIRKDIELSEMGPDIVFAIAVEKTYGQLEAARYLLALASGKAQMVNKYP